MFRSDSFDWFCEKRIALTLLMMLALNARLHSQEWNQWRGEARDARSVGDSWPDSLDKESLQVIWKVEDLGASYSSPVVQDGVIYITENSDGTSESISAIDEKTGDEIWTRNWPVSFRPPGEMRHHGAWPKSTPAVDSDVVIFFGVSEQLRCLNTENGETLWEIDFPKTYDTIVPEYGCSTSPLITKDAVFVHASGSLFSIDRKTGKPNWRAFNLYEIEKSKDLERETYGSPILVTLDEVPQVVISTVRGFIGVGAEDGEVLWKVDANRSFDDSPNTTPVVWKDHLLTVTESSGTPLYKITKSRDKFAAEEVWRSPSRGDMSSPVICGEHAYIHLKAGRLACLDLNTGKRLWGSKRSFGDYISMVVRDKKILILTTSGEFHLLQADPTEMKLLASRQVGKRTWAHLSADGNRIYLRDLNSLTVFQWVK